MSKALKDEHLENVNGGYTDDDIASPTFGETIVCPVCGESNQKKIVVNTSDDILKPGRYHCLSCGANFNPTKTSS